MTPTTADTAWQSMDVAPRDGTEIQAEIPGNGSDNVIAWLDDLLDSNERDYSGWTFTRGQEPPACWTDGVCLEVNEYGIASVKPTRWKPLAPVAKDGEPK